MRIASIVILVLVLHKLPLQMAGKMLSAGSTVSKHAHTHYYFTLRFSNVSRKDKIHQKCSLKAGMDDYYKYYSGPSHCIYVKTSKGIKKRASASVSDDGRLATTRHFEYFFPDVNNIEDYRD